MFFHDFMLRICTAKSEDDMNTIRMLLREYEVSLGVDLCFQNFERELASLPGDYAPPGGTLLMAYWDADVAGCVALRKLDSTACEMKRLSVRPAFRGKKIGRVLAEAVIGVAKTLGYAVMRLDTLPSMAEAQTLYAALGFREIAAYRYNPVPGSRFLELALSDAKGHSMMSGAWAPTNLCL